MARHDSTYGDWMAPAAMGAGAGALGATAYQHHQQQQSNRVIPQTPEQEIETSLAPSTIPRGPEIATPIPTSIPIASEPDSLATTPATSVDKSFLDGAEAVPAAASANIADGGFGAGDASGRPPRPLRNNTDISVSDLHVPGEYPKAAMRLV